MLEETYKLKPKDVLHDLDPIFLHKLMSDPNNKQKKEKTLSTQLSTLVQSQGEKYTDLVVTFWNPKDKEKDLEGTPKVRVIFE